MKHPLTIRLSPEARLALEKLAQQDARSMSSFVEKQVMDLAKEKGVWLHNAPKMVARR